MHDGITGSGNRLLDDLLMARGPGGQEAEVRAVCHAELTKHCDRVWTDPAGNLVGIIQGTTPGQGATNDGVLVMAHLDEIAMVVKRVEPDGTLRVVALGGANPVNFGVCPVDILTGATCCAACCRSARCMPPANRPRARTCSRVRCTGRTCTSSPA